MKALTRPLLLLAGHACVLLGLIGAFLPLLPTTPFLLLAAACYVRSSERHYRWLVGNRLFGPILRDWEERRGVTVRTKIIGLALLWTSLAYSAYRTDNRTVEWMLLGTGVGASLMILRLRTIPTRTERVEEIREGAGKGVT
jgi:uncharacterized protein